MDHHRVLIRCRIYDCRRFPNSQHINQTLVFVRESIYDRLERIARGLDGLVELALVLIDHRTRCIDQFDRRCSCANAPKQVRRLRTFEFGEHQTY